MKTIETKYTNNTSFILKSFQTDDGKTFNDWKSARAHEAKLVFEKTAMVYSDGFLIGDGWHKANTDEESEAIKIHLELTEDVILGEWFNVYYDYDNYARILTLTDFKKYYSKLIKELDDYGKI